MVAVWREARHFFTEKEQAALALTEAVILVADGVPQGVYHAPPPTSTTKNPPAFSP